MKALSVTRFPGYVFEVREGHAGVHLQAMYFERDVVTGDLGAKQYTRKWLLSPHMTPSEIVQTAFKCVLTSAEHRVRENFTYKGQRVYSPHYDVEDLVNLCAAGRTDAGGRQ